MPKLDTSVGNAGSTLSREVPIDLLLNWYTAKQTKRTRIRETKLEKIMLLSSCRRSGLEIEHRRNSQGYLEDRQGQGLHRLQN